MQRSRYSRSALPVLALLGIALLASSCRKPESTDGERQSSTRGHTPESPGTPEPQGDRDMGGTPQGQASDSTATSPMFPLVPELKDIRLGMRRYEIASTMGNPDILGKLRLRDGGNGVVMTYMDGAISILTDASGRAYQCYVNVTRSPRSNYPGKVLGRLDASSTPDDVLAIYGQPYSRSEPPAPAMLKYATPRGFVNFVWRGKGTEGEGQLFFAALAEF